MKYICADNVLPNMQYLPQRRRSETIGCPLLQLEAGTPDGSVAQPQ
jgi:hypothetical protein